MIVILTIAIIIIIVLIIIMKYTVVLAIITMIENVKRIIIVKIKMYVNCLIII